MAIQCLPRLSQTRGFPFFCRPTTTRAANFELENEYLSRAMYNINQKRTELVGLEEHTEQLRNLLKQNIEILEEDHGKAILVFSIVTAIFLPLLVSLYRKLYCLSPVY